MTRTQKQKQAELRQPASNGQDHASPAHLNSQSTSWDGGVAPSVNKDETTALASRWSDRTRTSGSWFKKDMVSPDHRPPTSPTTTTTWLCPAPSLFGVVVSTTNSRPWRYLAYEVCPLPPPLRRVPGSEEGPRSRGRGGWLPTHTAYAHLWTLNGPFC